MQSLVFADLDDTLFQTLRKCGNYTVDSLEPRAFLKDGSTISYATPKQTWLWQWLSGARRIIPVTARNYDAFSRVNLPFQDEAVLNHGAVILEKNGKLNPEWHDYMMDVLPPYAKELSDLWETVEAYALQNTGLKPRLINDFNVTWYGVIKHDAADESALDQIRTSIIEKHEAVVSERLYCHFNGNNLAVIPKVIGKAKAVDFLIEKYRNNHELLTTIGIGDSRTDLPFMALCDYSMLPNHSQLGELFK